MLHVFVLGEWQPLEVRVRGQRYRSRPEWREEVPWGQDSAGTLAFAPHGNLLGTLSFSSRSSYGSGLLCEY
jgi:hypothetical protein